MEYGPRLNVKCIINGRIVSFFWLILYTLMYINQLFCSHCFQFLLGGETAEARAVLDVSEKGAVVRAERLCAAPHTVFNRCSVSPGSSVQTGPGSSRRTAAPPQTRQPASL